MSAIHQITRGTRRYHLFDQPLGALHPTVSAWAVRVVANGGAMPSGNTLAALTRFMRALDSGSLTSKMLSVNAFVPDSLIATLTPLLVGGGNDPWTNNGFVSGDLTVNGLKGNGSNYLNTGLIPSTVYGTYASMGVTMYISSAGSGSEREFGSSVGSFNFQVTQLIVSYSGNMNWDAPYDSGTGRMAATNTLWMGYISANRTSFTANDVYKANSGFAHAAMLATNTTNVSSWTPSTSAMYCHAFNSAGTLTDPTTKRVSFAAANQGLTSAQSLAFYNAIQALRTDLGGGYV